jgi:hypothetical protein
MPSYFAGVVVVVLPVPELLELGHKLKTAEGLFDR